MCMAQVRGRCTGRVAWRHSRRENRFQSCHYEARSSEESLVCTEDLKREERFFAPRVYPELVEGVAHLVPTLFGRMTYNFTLCSIFPTRALHSLIWKPP